MSSLVSRGDTAKARGYGCETRTQWLLLEAQEDSVQQLQVLGQVVELCGYVSAWTSGQQTPPGSAEFQRT